MAGIREAARELGLNPSTVSRWVRQYPELNRGTDDEIDVDIEKLREHRAQNVNAAMSGNHAGLFQDENENQDASPAAGGGEDRGSVTPGLAAARTRVAEAQAHKAELDLAERLGEVVDLAGVEAAFRTAGVALRQAMESRARPLSEVLAGMTDARAIALRLDEEDRALLTRVMNELRKALGFKPPAG